MEYEPPPVEKSHNYIWVIILLGLVFVVGFKVTQSILAEKEEKPQSLFSDIPDGASFYVRASKNPGKIIICREENVPTGVLWKKGDEMASEVPFK